ncbi:MAG: FAD-dependent oxidoreductase [Tunicatimonas sp.]
MSTQSVDFLIVGQGLAGSLLSYHLLEQGCSVRLINTQHHRPSASRAAAGLYNPITGRKLVKTWRADELFPYLESCYAELQQRLGATFFHPTPIYRPLASAEDQNEWAVQLGDSAYATFVQEVHLKSRYGDLVQDRWGGLLLRHCGYVDVPQLLRAYRNFLIEQDSYEESVFDFDQLDVQDRHVHYREWTARRIIFCEGATARDNPYFSWLPFRPVKGEMISIRTEAPLPVIMNRGVFVIPHGQQGRVGSTYDHHDLSDTPTERARETLKQKLDQLLVTPYEITDQWAGVRPATRDRLPFIGIHPRHEPLGIFGGFGSKGVSLAPYFAQHFVHCMLKKAPVDEEVTILRYYPKHYPS